MHHRTCTIDFIHIFLKGVIAINLQRYGLQHTCCAGGDILLEGNNLLYNIQLIEIRAYQFCNMGRQLPLLVFTENRLNCYSNLTSYIKYIFPRRTVSETSYHLNTPDSNHCSSDNTARTKNSRGNTAFLYSLMRQDVRPSIV